MYIPSELPYITSDIRPEHFPPLIADALCLADDPIQRDIILLSALSACSYATPHVHLLHGKPQRRYFPNLMTLIIAPPASGKGMMSIGSQLLDPIQSNLCTHDRSAIIPADSTYAAFTKQLAENQGSAFVCDSEIDIISGAWKHDYNRYSALFRKAFEHEKINRSTMTTAKSVDLSDIECPCVSLLLSGTFTQIRPLLGSGENGLASRFLPYLIEEFPEFDESVFFGNDAVQENAITPTISRLAQDLFQRWQWLSSQGHDCLWCLTPVQEKSMACLFRDYDYLTLRDENITAVQVPLIFGAFVKRLAVSIKRIGAILSTLRLPIDHPLPERIYCNDEDFDTIYLLAEKFLMHAINLSFLLNEKSIQQQAVKRTTRSSSLISLLPNEFSTAEAVALATELGITERTIRNKLKEAVADKTIKRTTKGKYVKL